MKTSEKQKKLTQDYADFVSAYQDAKSQGLALGTFLEWQHRNDRAGVTIAKRGDK